MAFPYAPPTRDRGRRYDWAPAAQRAAPAWRAAPEANAAGGEGGGRCSTGPGSYEPAPAPPVHMAPFGTAARFAGSVEAWARYAPIQGTERATRAWTSGHSVGPVLRRGEVGERDRRIGHHEHPPTDINPDSLRAASLATSVLQSPLRCAVAGAEAGVLAIAFAYYGVYWQLHVRMGRRYAAAFRSDAARWRPRPVDELGPGAYDLPDPPPLAGAGVSRAAFCDRRPRGDPRLCVARCAYAFRVRGGDRLSTYTYMQTAMRHVTECMRMCMSSVRRPARVCELLSVT